ncbi:hypothetical protein CR158_17265 [Halomonas heilongjiangensis]|uniref:Uncharacterized protein n=2 Tax=Halomonas heilongjiangensis TaxID=1387883 RepID=A0A2N7THM7_9GAMM|nr:hypothetical protein [Halomonas heilongjiangensis]PMR67686.1 hypothetical protein C1H66_18220 [Halomonas heilongjiangensis]PXX87561.1 hypothetical protein CR158_17265 [Halomonas heilongjiangensis]
MPITDSMSLLWMSYGFLSLVVVLTGYLGLGFLPRLPRLVITWLVAGMIWVPARFRLPLLDEGEFYTGFAPAVMVAAVAFLERNASVMVPALLLLVAGGLAGAGVGLLLWWRGRHHHEYVDMDEDDEPMPPRRGGGGERREPMIG